MPFRPISKDHPRIRGVHWVQICFRTTYQGSSPHTRGPPMATCMLPARKRIIPAYAGSTQCSFASLVSTKDHPRIRGVHYKIAWIYKTVLGSSPHTRGPPFWDSSFIASRRIIPAYAGSTISGCSSCSRSRDHPRIRGVHRHRMASARRSIGSSPHTRGPHKSCKPQ